jgi:CheY-like chemotaxis protein
MYYIVIGVFMKRLKNIKVGDSFKVGDSIKYSKQSTGSRGKDYYNSEEFANKIEESNKRDKYLSKANKMYNKWSAHYTLEDLDNLAKLEEVTNRFRFKILLISENSFELNTWRNIAIANGFKNIVLAKNYNEAITELYNGEFNFVMSSYRFSDKCAREVYNFIKQRYTSEICNFRLVSGYNDHERKNLKSAGVPLLNMPVCGLDKELAHNNLTMVFRGFYSMYLVEMVYGREEAERIGSKINKFLPMLNKLERAASKNSFKILIVDDDEDVRLSTKTAIADLGFNNINEADSSTSAKFAMCEKEYDLVLSDYRLNDPVSGDGDKIFDFIYEKYGVLQQKPSFALVTGYSQSEMVHLKNKGILMINKIRDNETKQSYKDCLSILIKGFYVKSLRDIINKFNSIT